MPAAKPKEFKFNLGADPEFNLEVNNNKLHAENAINAIMSNSKTFKPKNQDGYELSPYGTMGWDGHSATGEIRPNASPKPEGVVENLKKMFEEFHKMAPLFEISTLSRTGIIGGHIHFELPEEVPSDAKMKAIHKRMISLYLPIIMGECKVNLNIRIKNNYGHLCDNSAFRKDAKFTRANGNRGYTYELRCPSAEWITTPKIAKSTLAYLGVVYNEIMNHPKHFEKICKEIIIKTDIQGTALQTLALCEYTGLTEGLFEKIKKCIKTFDLYDTFKEECDYILSPEKVIADKQAANYDVRMGWGLKVEKKEPGKRTIVSEKAFKRTAKEQDLDTLSKFIKVSYNEDMNVDSFAAAISKRCAAFNWKLNKSYFLFGIRKGITDYVVADNKGTIIKGKEILKVSSDKEALENLITKMRNKARQVLGNYDGVYNKLNFKTGKIEKIQNETIIIGIPYEERLNGKTKKFIELVYDIDKNKLKQTNRKEEALFDDRAKPEEEKGEIYKILNGIDEKNKQIAEDTEINTDIRDTDTIIMNEIIAEEAEVTMITGEHPTENNRPTARFEIINEDRHEDEGEHCGDSDCDDCNNEYGTMEEDEDIFEPVFIQNPAQMESPASIAIDLGTIGRAGQTLRYVDQANGVDINSNQPRF